MSKNVIFFLLMFIHVHAIADVQVPAPIVYFSFDGHLENAGTAVPDNGDIVEISGLTVLYSPGIKGLALDTAANTMNGPGSYVKIGADGSTDTPIENALNASIKSFTICGWIYATGAWQPSVSIIDRELPGPVYHYQIRLHSNDIYGQHRLRVNDQATSSTELGHWGEVNRWIFFAVTYDSTSSSGNVKFYKGYDISQGNVWLDNQTTLNAGTVQTSDKVMWLGATTSLGSASFQGLRDEFRIFADSEDSGGALTLEQLQEVHAIDLGKPYCGDATHPYPQGDLNYDCIVNILDFVEFSISWLMDF